MERKRWRSSLMATVIGIMLMGLVGAAHGTVKYTATDMGPNGDGMYIWQYDYFVTASQPFTDFYITFAYDNYYSLSLNNLISDTPLPSNPDWAISLTLTGPATYQNGVYNAVINSGSQGPGEVISGFSVQFVSATPTDQSYVIYDNRNAENSIQVESDTTVPTPEPSTWMLLTLSLGTIFFARRKLTGRVG